MNYGAKRRTVHPIKDNDEDGDVAVEVKRKPQFAEAEHVPYIQARDKTIGIPFAHKMSGAGFEDLKTKRFSRILKGPKEGVNIKIF